MISCLERGRAAIDGSPREVGALVMAARIVHFRHVVDFILLNFLWAISEGNKMD